MSKFTYNFKLKYKLGDIVVVRGYNATIVGFFSSGYITHVNSNEGYKVGKYYINRYGLIGMMKLGDKEMDLRKEDDAKVIKKLRDF